MIKDNAFFLMIFLMVIIGVLLVVEIINFILKYKKIGKRKDLISSIIMFFSFIFWAISIFLMVKKER